MSKAKHFYRTTRDVVDTIRFVDHLGQHVPSHDTTIEHRAGMFVFRGGKRAFAAHMDMLNATHGAGYAKPEEVSQ